MHIALDTEHAAASLILVESWVRVTQHVDRAHLQAHTAGSKPKLGTEMLPLP
jgi:hypothetical protein